MCAKKFCSLHGYCLICEICLAFIFLKGPLHCTKLASVSRAYKCILQQPYCRLEGDGFIVTRRGSKRKGWCVSSKGSKQLIKSPIFLSFDSCGELELTRYDNRLSWTNCILGIPSACRGIQFGDQAGIAQFRHQSVRLKTHIASQWSHYGCRSLFYKSSRSSKTAIPATCTIQHKW